jgi:menaquinol-cytochrome c reductase cytochrome b subunit
MATTYRRTPTKAELRRQKMEELINFPLDWFEERSGLIGGVRYFLFRNVPSDINWMQTLGSAALTAFLVQAITGVILAMYYVPSAATDPHTGKPEAWLSIVNITDHLTMGWLVRGMHKWGASVFIILMFLHMGRVFLFGAYKYPRELNWIIGVLILVMGMMEGFTGYLLPWDQTAYWASVVGINLNGTAPFLGPWLAQFLRSGQEISGETLTRFYSLHMLVIPGAIMALIGLHLYLVIRLGVTSPPWSKDAAGMEPEEADEDGRRAGLTRPVARSNGASGMQAEPGGQQ